MFFSSCKEISEIIFIEKEKVQVTNATLGKKTIPIDGFIFAKKGETIYSIANTYGLSPNDIILQNNLEKNINLNENQKIFLPYPLMHRVIEGDSIYSLSIQYAVNQSDIVSLNKLSKPYELKEFDNIKIPLEKDYSVIGLENKTKINIKKFSNILKNSVQALHKEFIWPVDGKIISEFGPSAGGKRHNDGVDIKIVKNTEIRASADGKVAFIGSNIKSFGNMILIKHSKELISAYSKVDRVLVSDGDFIKRGEIIAITNKGNILNFQIRKSRNPIDPRKFIDN